MPAKLLYTYQFGQPWRPAPFDVPHGGSVVIESGCLKIYGPVERPAEPWTGDGLPPVGSDCEVLWTDSTLAYRPVHVVAHDGDRAVFRFTSGADKGQYAADKQGLCVGAPVFRPMRSAEELEREAKLDDLVKRFGLVGFPDVQWRDLFAQMLDAGALK